MKKFLTFSLIVLAASFFANDAKAQAYQKGDKLLNAGIGLGTYGLGGLGFGGSLEFGISDDISVGPIVGYSGTSDFGTTFSVFTIGGRGSYHFNKLLGMTDDKLDLYGGLGLGYHSISYGGSSIYGSGITFLGHLGGRYYLSKNLGIFAELGSGFGTLTAGLALKF